MLGHLTDVFVATARQHQAMADSHIAVNSDMCCSFITAFTVILLEHALRLYHHVCVVMLACCVR
jgi:hypothetical protein